MPTVLRPAGAPREQCWRSSWTPRWRSVVLLAYELGSSVAISPISGFPAAAEVMADGRAIPLMPRPIVRRQAPPPWNLLPSGTDSSAQSMMDRYHPGEPEYLPGEPEESSNPVQAAGEPFDCVYNLEAFKFPWSPKRKEWCCANKGICIPSEAANTSAAVTPQPLDAAAPASHEEVTPKVRGHDVCLSFLSEEACLGIGCCWFAKETNECESLIGNDICEPLRQATESAPLELTTPQPLQTQMQPQQQQQQQQGWLNFPGEKTVGAHAADIWVSEQRWWHEGGVSHTYAGHAGSHYKGDRHSDLDDWEDLPHKHYGHDWEDTPHKYNSHDGEERRKERREERTNERRGERAKERREGRTEERRKGRRKERRKQVDHAENHAHHKNTNAKSATTTHHEHEKTTTTTTTQQETTTTEETDTTQQEPTHESTTDGNHPTDVQTIRETHSSTTSIAGGIQGDSSHHPETHNSSHNDTSVPTFVHPTADHAEKITQEGTDGSIANNASSNSSHPVSVSSSSSSSASSSASSSDDKNDNSEADEPDNEGKAKTGVQILIIVIACLIGITCLIGMSGLIYVTFIKGPTEEESELPANAQDQGPTEPAESDQVSPDTRRPSDTQF